jgi:hypothetical protein
MNLEITSWKVITLYVVVIVITTIITFHHEVKPRRPVSVSAFTPSSSLVSGRPDRRLPFE